MAHFPKTKGFTDTLRPIRMECDILDLETEGEIPANLNGTFHRVHPDAQFPPRFENDQFFNGDGLITLFRFQNGRIDLKQRYAQTDKFKVERKAGRVAVRHVPQPAHGRREREGHDPWHGQHHAHRACGQAVRAEGRQPAADHGSADAGDRGLQQLRRQDEEPDVLRRIRRSIRSPATCAISATRPRAC